MNSLLCIPSPARPRSGSMRVSHMISALREYSTVDPSVSHHLWVLVFPIVWAAFDKQQQVWGVRGGGGLYRQAFLCELVFLSRLMNATLPHR